MEVPIKSELQIVPKEEKKQETEKGSACDPISTPTLTQTPTPTAEPNPELKPKPKLEPKQKKEVEIDYLTEDSVIPDQKFVCISIIKPTSLSEKKLEEINKKGNGKNNLTVNGIKVRGSYATYEEAQKRCEFLQKCDPYHNIYIGEVGKWCPFEDDPTKAKNSEYMNKDLNKLMKNYDEQQNEAKEYHEIRKQDMVRKAMEDLTKRKKENINSKIAEVEAEVEESKESKESKEPAEPTRTENKEKIIEYPTMGKLVPPTSTSTSVPSEIKKKNKKNKLEKLNEMKTELESSKENLTKEKKEIDENISNLRKLEDELAEKIKEMELEQSKSK